MKNELKDSQIQSKLAANGSVYISVFYFSIHFYTIKKPKGKNTSTVALDWISKYLINIRICLWKQYMIGHQLPGAGLLRMNE